MTGVSLDKRWISAATVALRTVRGKPPTPRGSYACRATVSGYGAGIDSRLEMPRPRIS
jgi:hypothetical protein